MSPFDDHRIRVFRAPTTHEALKRVRSALGGDAVVLRTRQVVDVDELTKQPRRLVEVTASAEPLGDAPVPRRTRPAPPPIPPATQPVAPEKTATPIDRPPAVAPTSGEPERSSEPAAVDHPDVAGRLETIELALAALLETRLTPRPVELSPSSVAAPPSDALPPQPADSDTERTLPTTAPIAWPQRGESSVIAVVGPAQSGRTTTVAKLAAAASLYRGHRVGVVQSNPLPAEADRQLHAIATALDFPLLHAADSRQLQAALAELATCDLVLIDACDATTGRPSIGGDRQSRLAVASQTLLTLSLNEPPATWPATIDASAALRPTAAVLTYADRLPHAAIALPTSLPIAAIACGPRVPSDLYEPTAADLADLFMADPSMAAPTMAAPGIAP